MARILRILRCAIVLLIADNTMVNLRTFARAMPTDVIPKAPGALAHVKYNSGVEVNQGSVLTPTSVKNQPAIKWGASPGQRYTVVRTATMSLVAQAFQASKIVPDVIPTAPTSNIQLTYPSGAIASQGNELTPTQVKEQPTVTFEADPNAYYTLVFTDPDNYDGPEPVYREWHHWLVGNIPGGDVRRGEVLSGYIGSGPPDGTGIHRYVYILYKQPGKLKFDEKRLTNKSIDGRAAFSTKKFAEKYNLGAPVAGNFYRAQFDDYVPLLYKGLGV